MIWWRADGDWGGEDRYAIVQRFGALRNALGRFGYDRQTTDSETITAVLRGLSVVKGPPGGLYGAVVRYVPNPAHKRETTEAGPPRWRPDKEPCPPEMTPRERAALLRGAVPEHPDLPSSRRFAVRRGGRGLEFFAAQATRTAEDGEVEYHGYPTHRVPGKVLRRFRDRGDITVPEYRQLVKRLG